MRLAGLLSSAALCFFLMGCAGDDMSDLRMFVDEVKSRQAGRIAPLPEIRQIETFVYTASEARDPFQPSDREEETVAEAPTSGIHPDFSRRKEELEYFPLDSIRMVGTLEQKDLAWGLVQSTDGTIYRVRPGNYLGQNHGQINRILEDRIELTEIVPDGQGGYFERQASMALNE